MKDYFAGLSKPGATIIFVAFISLSTCMVGLSQSQTEEAVAALEGLDPVMLVQGKEVQGSLKITVRDHTPLRDVWNAMIHDQPKRSLLGLALMVGQSLFYNAVFLTYGLVLAQFSNYRANEYLFTSCR